MGRIRQLRTTTLRVISTLVLTTLVPLAANAQTYPNKPIRIIVPYAAGGAVDIIGRIIGQPLSEQLKQPVIVDNRPGASANIGMELAAKAAPEGYVLLMASNGIATNMALFPTLTFNVLYCFFIISHDRRRILHANITKHPAKQSLMNWTTFLFS